MTDLSLAHHMARQVRPPEAGSTVAAWAVHLFSASGAVLALLALLAIERQQPREALLWLFAALVVDGVDGTLARLARVRERISRVDGEALDLVIDYLTYVFLPVLFILNGGYLPGPAALPLCAAILISSLYVFARRDMKTPDGYFRGFPALWNVVALYFFVLDPAPAAAALAVAALIVMTFAPVHVVHPFRVADFGWPLPAVAVLWGIATAALLLPGLSAAAIEPLAALSLATAAILVAIGLARSWRGPRVDAQ